MKVKVSTEILVHVYDDFQDDIALTQKQVAMAAAKHASAGKGLFGDICQPPTRVRFMEPFEKDGKKVWPVGVVFESEEEIP